MTNVLYIYCNLHHSICCMQSMHSAAIFLHGWVFIEHIL